MRRKKQTWAKMATVVLAALHRTRCNLVTDADRPTIRGPWQLCTGRDGTNGVIPAHRGRTGRSAQCNLRLGSCSRERRTKRKACKLVQKTSPGRSAQKRYGWERTACTLVQKPSPGHSTQRRDGGKKEGLYARTETKPSLDSEAGRRDKHPGSPRWSWSLDTGHRCTLTANLCLGERIHMNM